MATMDQCQRNYDAMMPEDEYCPVCGYEASVDCICTGDECQECKKNPCICEHTYCPDCKTVDGCSCDEQYEAYRDNERGL